MTLRNVSTNTILATAVEIADTPLSRMRGLLGRPGMPCGSALVITHCNSIHMFFMKFAIDALFIDKQGKVVGLVRHIQPFQLSPIFFKSSQVIELPAGTIDHTRTSLNDHIKID